MSHLSVSQQDPSESINLRMLREQNIDTGKKRGFSLPAYPLLITQWEYRYNWGTRSEDEQWDRLFFCLEDILRQELKSSDSGISGPNDTSFSRTTDIGQFVHWWQFILLQIYVVKQMSDAKFSVIQFFLKFELLELLDSRDLIGQTFALASFKRFQWIFFARPEEQSYLFGFQAIVILLGAVMWGILRQELKSSDSWN